jgi:hypothetical protein
MQNKPNNFICASLFDFFVVIYLTTCLFFRTKYGLTKQRLVTVHLFKCFIDLTT